MRQSCIALLVLLFAGALPAAAAGVTLVDGGQARAAVILPAEPADFENQAAEELVEHIRLISGAELPVVSGTPPAGLLPVRLGTAAAADLEERARAAGDNPSSFTLSVGGNGVSIRGVSPEGTLFGVYELLEQLGVRWYIPGDLGRVIPKGENVRLAVQETVQAPSMDLRLLQPWTGATDGWIARVRLGGERRSTGAHGIPPYTGTAGQRTFESNPEYFALIGGERRRRQICASNPGAVALTVATLRERYAPTSNRFYVGMGPNDGGGYCECDNCAALDGDVYDPFYSTTSRTGRYIWFFNQVLEAMEDDYPNLHLVWYVYASHMMPPPPELKPNPRIVGVFAPISIDRIRGMDNPMSPDRHTLRWVIDQWSALEPNELYYRGYYNNLACIQLPISQVDRIRHEIPAIHALGVNVMRVECIAHSWASNTISLYLAARLMWDVNTDVDALLDEFYEKFYGPAAGPMGEYHQALDAAFRDTPYFTGSTYVYFPIFDAARRDSMRRMLVRAQRLVRRRGDDLYPERVWAARQAFDRMEIFLDMIAARNRFDFQAVGQLLERYHEVTATLSGYVLEGAGRRRPHRLGTTAYFQRFFEKPLTDGYHRTVEAGELVAGLPDEWDFLLDPSGIGELGGWQRPGPLGGNWQRLKTSSRSWSDQGLHYYKGLAWYRTEVEIPERFRGRRIYLWLGGVDNVATIWVNGRYLGTSRDPGEGLPGVPRSFQPFDVEATGALRFGPGATNTVTIRVNNPSLSELGTGGITAPVMFWSPHDPDWTP